MRKFFPVLLFILPVLLAFTGDLESGTRKSLPSGCFVRGSNPGKGVRKTETKLLMTFKVTDGTVFSSDSIQLSYNGTTTVARPDKNGQAWLTVPAKKTRFQFFRDSNFFEIYSDSISLQGGHVTELEVIFSPAEIEISVDKPVIYVYPDSTQAVSIQLEVKGQLGFTYPACNTSCMNGVVRGWKFTADPDGTIHMNDKEYDYLFWEGKVPFSTVITDHKKGFIVQRDSLVPFFERNLTVMGLNAREQQDFITYWCPVMQKYERSFVQFRFNDECNSIAGMNITPKPDHLFRVYMIFEDASEMEWNTEPGQIIPQVIREGFTVIEWGGADVSAQFTVRGAQSTVRSAQ